MRVTSNGLGVESVEVDTLDGRWLTVVNQVLRESGSFSSASDQLMIGSSEAVIISRGEVEQLVQHLQAWLKTGRLVIHAEQPAAPDPLVLQRAVDQIAGTVLTDKVRR